MQPGDVPVMAGHAHRAFPDHLYSLVYNRAAELDHAVNGDEGRVGMDPQEKV